jgi:hypothetical protein
MSEKEKIMAQAGTQALRDVTKLAVAAGRSAIAAGGFSSRFANSLVGKVTPGFTLDPSGYIHTTINYADVFEKGATIAGKPWLWLPLPSVPPIAGRPHMTPAQYIANVGPLILMRRPGKPPMLGTKVRTTSPTTRPTRRILSRGISGRVSGQVSVVPLFVGVSTVNIPKKFDVEGAVQTVFDANMQKLYLQYLDDLGAGNL